MTIHETDVRRERFDVFYWHFSDIPPAPRNVRYRG
jgi:hypothetical protein